MSWLKFVLTYLKIKKKKIEDVKDTSVFSVLADETVDISRTKQLSIGVRYLRFDQENKQLAICEEFLGYTQLKKLNALFISLSFWIISVWIWTDILAKGMMVALWWLVMKVVFKNWSETSILVLCSFIVPAMYWILLSMIWTAPRKYEMPLERRRKSLTFSQKVLYDETRFLTSLYYVKHAGLQNTGASKYFLIIFKYYANFEGTSDNAVNSNTKVKAHLLFTTIATCIVTLIVIATYSAKPKLYEINCSMLIWT